MKYSLKIQIIKHLFESFSSANEYFFTIAFSLTVINVWYNVSVHLIRVFPRMLTVGGGGFLTIDYCFPYCILEIFVEVTTP